MRIRDAYTRLGGTGVRTDKADGAKATKKDAGASADAASSTSAGDATKLSLSARAVALTQAADVSQNPRVAQLRDQVRAGTLKIDAGKIASALLGGDE